MCKELLVVHACAFNWYVLLDDDRVFDAIVREKAMWTVLWTVKLTESILREVDIKWFYKIENYDANANALRNTDQVKL